MKPSRTLLAPLLALGVLAACQRGPVEPPHVTPTQEQTPPSTAAPSAVPANPGPATALPQGHPPMAAAGGLQWDDPAGWTRVQPASPMRRAQLRIPRAEGDTADAELVVITFGPNQGGSVESNLARWYGQVQLADGGSTEAAATRETLTAGNMQVTVTEVAGRIAGSNMPGAPPGQSFEQGRLLAAIVESPQGPWFFKIIGPDRTVAAARASFLSMLRTMRFQGGAAAPPLAMPPGGAAPSGAALPPGHP